jgi:hypothetical protein
VTRVKPIRCLVPPTMEPTFRTPQEALAYRAPRNVQLERDTLGLKNRVIEGGSWTDARFELYLSNAKTLRIDLEGIKVGWSVSPRSPVVPAMPVRDRQPLALELRSGAAQRPRRVLWDREAAFRRCIGRRFKKAFAGAACLWLYTEGTSSLLYFSRLVLEAGEKDFLYWTEEK